MSKTSHYIGNGLYMLDQDQYQHFQRVSDILSRHHLYFDQSFLGSGKSFIALALCIKYNLKLFVVCPVSSTYMWRKLADKYNVNVIDIISYGSLRGQGPSKKLNHPYLHKHHIVGDLDQKKNSKAQISYTATKTFQDICTKNDILLVADEAQNVKNDGLQCRSLHALIEAVQNSTGSRCAILSGSLIDQVSMAINMLRMLGFYGKQSKKLYYFDIGRRSHNFRGYQEIVDECMHIDPVTTKSLSMEFLPTGGKNGKRSFLTMVQDNVYNLFAGVVLEQMSSSMPDPKLPADLMNGFYIITNPIMKKWAEEAKNAIQRATGYTVSSSGKSLIDWKKKSLDVITKSLVQYELALLEICVRETIKWLELYPKGKVVIFVNFTKSIHLLYRELQHYGAARYYGRLKSDERDMIETRFQTDPSLRVLIANIQCGGQGINLHDTSVDGQCKRLALIIPTYKLIPVYQACGRIIRKNMTSVGTVRIIYSKEFPLDSVFDAIARKSNVLIDINQRGSGGTKRLYPGDFNKYYETEKDLENQSISRFIKKQKTSAFQLEPVEEEIIEEDYEDEDEDAAAVP